MLPLLSCGFDILEAEPALPAPSDSSFQFTCPSVCRAVVLVGTCHRLWTQKLGEVSLGRACSLPRQMGLASFSFMYIIGISLGEVLEALLGLHFRVHLWKISIDSNPLCSPVCYQGTEVMRSSHVALVLLCHIPLSAHWGFLQTWHDLAETFRGSRQNQRPSEHYRELFWMAMGQWAHGSLLSCLCFFVFDYTMYHSSLLSHFFGFSISPVIHCRIWSKPLRDFKLPVNHYFFHNYPVFRNRCQMNAVIGPETLRGAAESLQPSILGDWALGCMLVVLLMGAQASVCHRWELGLRYPSIWLSCYWSIHSQVLKGSFFPSFIEI